MVFLREIYQFLSTKMKCSISYGLNLESDSISQLIKLDINNQDKFALFWINEKNLIKLDNIKCGIVICPLSTARPVNFTGALLTCENPRRAFSSILKEFFNSETLPLNNLNILTRKIPNVIIGHGTIIEEGVEIGKGTIIGYNNVILKGTIIGKNVKIGSNNTIGGIGFGYEKNENNEYEQIPHIGRVLIEDNVEIGNNNCIDRAVLGATLLKNSCKIDNLVHIAHGVTIGQGSLIIANSMIAGSAIIEDNVWIAPSTSVINGGLIKSNAMTGLGAVVLHSVEENSLVVGVPAKKIKDI